MISKQSKYIINLSKTSEAVKMQFFPSSKEKLLSDDAKNDPLNEDKYKIRNGLIRKHKNRVLIILTLQCASYCRFCTRKRCVSNIEKGELTDNDLLDIASYIEKNTDINEVIISGGDPLTAPKKLLRIYELLIKIKHINLFRIGTRLPFVSPEMCDDLLISVFSNFEKNKKPIYLMLHIEHPDELTEESLNALAKISPYCTAMFSQSVFLKKINDNEKILCQLFTKLIACGIKPYYIFHCDNVFGAKHFIVPIEKERKIMQSIRKKISGLACPTYVIDTDKGKILG